MNTIIALFKDTSLVIIIGLFDLFSSVQQATVDPHLVGYVDGRLCFRRTDLLDLLFQHVTL